MYLETDGLEGPAQPGETPDRYVTRLSLQKAQRGASDAGAAVVLGADTAVVLGDEVLGKPANEADAVAMLRRLRGRQHRVVTGVTLIDAETDATISRPRSTDVTLRHYADGEMEAYVASGGPMDKAGAYAVQDMPFRPAERIEGCYLNVVGLPLCDVTAMLGELGLSPVLRRDWAPPPDCVDCPLSRAKETSS